MFGGPSGRLPSLSQYQFSQVPQANIPRSTFNRSHGYKTTFNSGYLIPFYADEVLPGDTFNCQVTTFGRLATPIVPIMDNIYCDAFFFFVPLRLLWTNFRKFMGEQDNPGDSTSFVQPVVTKPGGGWLSGSLTDYLGMPTGTWGNPVAYWHRAYNQIWNEWFRDENLQNSVPKNVGDGPDADTDYTLLRRGKRHDYFTSCLPWPQKGTAVSIPLGTQAPVKGIGIAGATVTSATSPTIREWGGATRVYTDYLYTSAASGVTIEADAASSSSSPKVYADLSAATAATINSLRLAFQTQKLYERDARGGTRYTEIVRSHFGVVSPDQRLQRPEFLGGGTAMINVSPIPQTSSTDATTPQGNLAAMMTFGHKGIGFMKSFVEHGVILGLVSVRVDQSYQDGVERMFSRSTRLDHYWPALAHIGEQAVLNREIWADGSGNDALTFGYQERWAEYKYKPSKITGRFRSYGTGLSGPLDYWHLATKFASLPALNATFIQENPPLQRVIAVTSQPEVLFDAYIKLQCARPMPVYSVPGLIDHF